MKNDDKFLKKLTPEEYHVMREKGTEMPFTGKFVNFNKKGMFTCKACGNVIFDSKTKFDSDCGWPSFYDAVPNSVELKTDLSHGMKRTEVICAKCKSHLGHVFRDAPKTPTGNRYCINSIAMNFK
jgi:peptide-methionine (R)-S-oxide reductase